MGRCTVAALGCLLTATLSGCIDKLGQLPRRSATITPRRGVASGTEATITMALDWGGPSVVYVSTDCPITTGLHVPGGLASLPFRSIQAITCFATT